MQAHPDYKADRERLEKRLDGKTTAELQAMAADAMALMNQRKGVNDFLNLLLTRMGGKFGLTRREIAAIAEEYAGIASDE